MSKFIIISKIWDGIAIAHQLAFEGEDVMFWNEGKDANEIGTGWPDLKRTNKEEIKLSDLVNKNKKGIFVFDGSEWGSWQDILRRKGIPVIGSSGFGDKVESDRMYGMEVQKKLGVRSPEYIEVDSIDNAIKHIKKNPKRYILKQTGDLPKTLNYKAIRDDSLDMIHHLLNVKEKFTDKLDGKLILQDIVEGTEVACGAWFNGHTWIKQDGRILLEVNFENKKELEGDKGCTTGETGTVAWFKLYQSDKSADDRNIADEIFEQCLLPLEETLVKENYTGCVDANTIVQRTNDSIYLLEWTMRFGYPITDLYIEMLDEPLGEFFRRLAGQDGTSASLSAGDGYHFVLNKKGVVLVLAFPCFPYEGVKSEKDSYTGEVIDLDALDDEELSHVHLYEVKVEENGEMKGLIRIAGTYGYALTVTAMDEDLKKANKKAVKIIEKIVPAKNGGRYREDIAERVGKRMKELNIR